MLQRFHATGEPRRAIWDRNKSASSVKSQVALRISLTLQQQNLYFISFSHYSSHELSALGNWVFPLADSQIVRHVLGAVIWNTAGPETGLGTVTRGEELQSMQPPSTGTAVAPFSRMLRGKSRNLFTSFPALEMEPAGMRIGTIPLSHRATLARD